LIGNAAQAKPKEYSTEDYYDYFTLPIPTSTEPVTIKPSEPYHTDHFTGPHEVTWDPNTSNKTDHFNSNSTWNPEATSTDYHLLTEAISFNNNSETLNVTDEVIVTFTKPMTTVSVPVLASNEFQFNSSVVIVWEKCGLESRTQVTHIFKSVYHSHLQVIFSYDPSINVIIYELFNKANSSSNQKQVLKLPNLAGELLFFVFNEPGKVL